MFWIGLREEELENESAISKKAMSFDGMKMKITLVEDKVLHSQAGGKSELQPDLLPYIAGVLCFLSLGYI